MSKLPAVTSKAAPPAKGAPDSASIKSGTRMVGGRQVRRGIGSPIGNMLILCVLVLLGVLSFPSLLLFCFGMLPSAVAYLIDRHRRWALTFTVLAPNLAATGAFMIRLLMNGATLNGVMDMMSNPFVWCMIYIAAAVGWAIYRGMPILVTSAKEYRLEAQRAGYEAEMKRLREEWGPDIDPPEPPAKQPAKPGAQVPEKTGAQAPAKS